MASSSQTLTLNLGTGSGAATVNIATGATAAKTVNIATSASLLHTLNIGTPSSTTLLQGNTVTIASSTDALTLNLGANTGRHTINIATGQASSTINIGSSSSSVAISSSNWTISTSGTSTIGVTNQIAFFNLSSCPSGWTEFTAARGRYIVALPSGGTLASTTGTALTDLENRAVGQHTHPITDPGHTHVDTVAGGGGASTGAQASGDRAGAIASVFNSGSSTTGLSITATGTTAGTNAPYIQLLACQKS